MIRSELVAATDDLGSQTFYHGTRANLKHGYTSNYGKKKATYVYLTGTLDAATWGAELALGEGPGRICITQVPSHKNACSRVKAKIKAESLSKKSSNVTA